MKEGDILLTAIPQSDGNTKNRPALLLKFMPPFSDCLICGVSSQLHHGVVDFDEIIDFSHPNFQISGLKTPSVIRL